MLLFNLVGHAHSEGKKHILNDNSQFSPENWWELFFLLHLVPSYHANCLGKIFICYSGESTIAPSEVYTITEWWPIKVKWLVVCCSICFMAWLQQRLRAPSQLRREGDTKRWGSVKVERLQLGWTSQAEENNEKNVVQSGKSLTESTTTKEWF